MDKNIKFNSFDINNIQKNNNEEISISQDLYKKATELVLKDITQVQGTNEEVEIHNMVLAKCVNGDKVAQANVKSIIKKIIEKDYKLAIPPISDALVKKIYQNNFGLGAIDEIFNDKSISEIWVNGCEHVWIEKDGRAQRLDTRFESDEDVMRIIRLILQFDKKDITIQTPMQESKMLDGSRITILIPPVGKRPYINIRKFESFDPTTEHLVMNETLNKEMGEWIDTAVKGRTNILVIGETGAGKTSFIKWMCGLIKPTLRVGTIETDFELRLDEKYPDRNIIAYEEHLELGVAMQDLFKKMLRSRPDIIICGESRGADAEQLIQCMRRGHEGSMSSIHTNSPETSISDIGEMINEDGQRRDPEQLRHRIASAIDVIIQIKRFEETGKRKITRITEVVEDNKSFNYELVDIFKYEINPGKPNEGEFVKQNKISSKYAQKLNYFGIPLDEIEKM